MENKDLMIKFWEDYYNADAIERSEMVKKTLIMKRCSGIKNNAEKSFSKETKEIIMSSLLTSYFDDLIMFMEVKNNDPDKH